MQFRGDLVVVGAAVVVLIFSSFWYRGLCLSRCKKNRDGGFLNKVLGYRDKTASLVLIAKDFSFRSYLRLASSKDAMLIIIVMIDSTKNRDMTTSTIRRLAVYWTIFNTSERYRGCIRRVQDVLVFPSLWGTLRSRYDADSIIPFVTLTNFRRWHVMMTCHTDVQYLKMREGNRDFLYFMYENTNFVYFYI